MPKRRKFVNCKNVVSPCIKVCLRSVLLTLHRKTLRLRLWAKLTWAGSTHAHRLVRFGSFFGRADVSHHTCIQQWRHARHFVYYVTWIKFIAWSSSQVVFCSLYPLASLFHLYLLVLRRHTVSALLQRISDNILVHAPCIPLNTVHFSSSSLFLPPIKKKLMIINNNNNNHSDEACKTKKTPSFNCTQRITLV